MARSNHAVAYRTDDGVPWIGFQGVATNGTPEQMFKAAKLDGWNVEKRLIVTGAVTDSDDYEIVRNHGKDAVFRLGLAKERYLVWQNEDVLAFALNTVFGDLIAVAAGQLNNGRRMFMSFKIGNDVEIKNTDGDKVAHYLNVMTSHDGSWAFGSYSGNMRLACQNMLGSAKAGALTSFKLRHTTSLAERVELARKALGVAIKQNDVVQKEYAGLAAVKVTDKQFWDIVEHEFPKPEKDVKGSMTKWENRREELAGIWNGPTLADLPHSLYRVYNAFNEHNRWYSTVRAGNVENALVRASGWDVASNNQDVRLLRHLHSLV